MIRTSDLIPVSEPEIGERELEYLTECLRTGWISSAGRFIDQFESAWAGYCGRRFGIAVANGTVALQAAVAALDLEPGDEVIIPSFTIISCALAVLYAGGTPVLVDSDPETWTMDVAQLEGKVTSRTRAIMPVHIYGHPADMDPILDLAARHGLAVIEDAAEAHGARYLSGRASDAPSWRRCGGFGQMSAFSFYANKLVTTGEGGMVLTDDEGLAERLRKLRNLCFESGRRFYHESAGFNFRMTNMQAAVGLAQVERIEGVVERKRRIGREYRRRLQGLPGLTLQAERPWAESVNWMFGLLLDPATGLDADAFAARLREQGVETRPFFLGMHEQPVFHRRGLFLGESYPVTERLARQGLYLPSGVGLTSGQLDAVCQAVGEVLA
jgi:perosamine synthetase